MDSSRNERVLQHTKSTPLKPTNEAAASIVTKYERELEQHRNMSKQLELQFNRSNPASIEELMQSHRNFRNYSEIRRESQPIMTAFERHDELQTPNRYQ